MSTQPHPINDTTAKSRADINRENAQHSTGPRTAEGKQRVAQNAVKHGLTAQTLCLIGDEAQRYQELLGRLMFTFQPRTAIETDLVHKICDAEWKAGIASVQYMNLVAISTREHMEEFQDLADNPGAQHCYAQIAALRANARLLEQLSRHENRFNRIVEKCTWELKDAVSERQEQERTVLEAQKAETQKAAAQKAAEALKHAASKNSAKQSQPPSANPQNAAQPPSEEEIDALARVVFERMHGFPPDRS